MQQPVASESEGCGESSERNGRRDGCGGRTGRTEGWQGSMIPRPTERRQHRPERRATISTGLRKPKFRPMVEYTVKLPDCQLSPRMAETEQDTEKRSDGRTERRSCLVRRKRTCPTCNLERCNHSDHAGAVCSTSNHRGGRCASAHSIIAAALVPLPPASHRLADSYIS